MRDLWVRLRAAPDPLLPTLLLCLVFFLLGLNRLWLPDALYFDEPHYVPAALKLLLGEEVRNREHPMLGKEIIALFVAIFGASTTVYRLAALAMATVGLFGFMRAQWIMTRSRGASLLLGFLIVGNGLYLSVGRVAMLDSIMTGFVGLSFLFFARALTADHERKSFVLSAVLIGFAMATKWTALPVILVMLGTLAWASRETFRGALRAIVFFGATVVMAYLITFVPAFLVENNPYSLRELPALHLMMKRQLGLLLGNHYASSTILDWLWGDGQIWAFDGRIAGLDRVAVIGQNPLAAIVAVPAILTGTILAAIRGDRNLLFPIAVYGLSLAFWIASRKPVLFLYSYDIPSVMALSVLASIISLHLRPPAWLLWGFLASYLLAFATIYPLLTMGKLNGRDSALQHVPGWYRDRTSEPSTALVGNGAELRRWMHRCLDSPLHAVCRQDRQNTVQSAGPERRTPANQ